LAETSRLTLTPSEPNVTKFNSGGGLRVFCSACGSPLCYEPVGLPQFRGIPLGVIDEGSVAKPAMHVWTKSKAAWASIIDGLPQHDTHP
jgi:hypothetical protein